jgi:hypothetical protein
MEIQDTAYKGITGTTHRDERTEVNVAGIKN